MSKALNDHPLGETSPTSNTPTDALSKTASKQGDDSAKKKRRGASVLTYLAVLFAAAFLMLLVAYFVQQRNRGAMLNYETPPTIEISRSQTEEPPRTQMTDET